MLSGRVLSSVAIVCALACSVDRKSGSDSESGGTTGANSGGKNAGGSSSGGKQSGSSGGSSSGGVVSTAGSTSGGSTLGNTGGAGGAPIDEGGAGAGGDAAGAGGISASGGSSSGGTASGGKTNSGGTSAGGVIGAGGAAKGGTTSTGGTGAGGAGKGGAANGGTGSGGAGKGGTGSGGAPVGGAANCDLTKPFGTATFMSGLNTSGEEGPPYVMPDGLSVYMGSGNNNDVNIATRSTVLINFSAPTPLGIVASGAPVSIGGIAVTANGLTMYYTQNWRFGSRIQLATRPSLSGTWTDLYEIAVPGVTYYYDPWLSTDEKRLYFANATNSDQAQIVMTTIGSAGFSNMTAVGGLAATEMSFAPVLTADERTIYFGSTRPGTGTKGDVDIWTASRASSTGDFTNLKPVSELNSAAWERPGSLSADGCVLYFLQSSTSTSTDVYIAKKPL